jgi:CDP-diacylglycerol--glycerol-3-phosphate 3-phosphatidyltransferase
VLQCAAVIAILLALIYPNVDWLSWLGPILLWSAILLTVYSGYDYTVAAARAMRDTPTDDRGD